MLISKAAKDSGEKDKSGERKIIKFQVQKDSQEREGSEGRMCGGERREEEARRERIRDVCKRKKNNVGSGLALGR